MIDIGWVKAGRAWRLAVQAALNKPKPGNPRRRGKPDGEADGAPVTSPRNPTLSGGAAAMLDFDPAD